jgi:transposase
MVAARHNPKIRPFHQHLRERGKAPKLALTACMRKLLVILNALLKAGQPWETRQAARQSKTVADPSTSSLC